MSRETAAICLVDKDHYREWRLEQSVAPTRLLMLLSTFVWGALPLVAPLPQSGHIPEVFYWLCWAILTPGCILILFMLSSPLRRHFYSYSILAFPFTGLATMWFVAELWHSSHGVATSGLWYCFLCSFIRLPAKHTLCIAVTVTSAAAWVLLEYFQYPLNQIWADLVFLSLGTLLIGTFAFMNERLLRQSFMQQQTIAQQHEALEARQQETEASRNLIRRYVPAAVADNIISGNESDVAEPQRRRITVLFSDIVGFTDLADRLDAESLTQIINEYMAAMADIVDAHQGTVNEFIGDGVMALFGAPVALPPEVQAKQAIAAAQAMQARMPDMYQSWRKLGLEEELKIRIGINTGVLSVGSFGSEGRVTYTAIGLQTNIAARIQSHCPPGGILISNATYQLVDDVIDCEPRGEVECKGVHYPVKVYAPS